MKKLGYLALGISKFLAVVIVFSSDLALNSCSDNENGLKNDDYQVSPARELGYDTIVSNGEIAVWLNPYRNRGSLSLKGAMHNHTDNSRAIDGYGSGNPYDIGVKFRDEGHFDFYAISDHNFLTNDPGVPGIVWMGCTLEDTNVSQDGHHLIVYNLPGNYKYFHVSDDINKQIAYYHSIGAFVSYAHPDWEYQYQPSDKINSVKNVDFVEVFNTVAGGSIRAYNNLMLRNNTFAFATDDYHHRDSWDNPEQYFNGSYIVVYSTDRSRNAIWAAILTGAFYATTGAKIEIKSQDGSVKIITEEPSRFDVCVPTTASSNNYAVIKTTDHKTEFEYSLTTDFPIVWFYISNSTGKAITQPIKLLK